MDFFFFYHIFFMYLQKDIIILKICSFSDIHGNLDFTIKACDLVLICGDIVPLNIQSFTKPSERWFKNTFNPKKKKKTCDKDVCVGGNHDKWLCNHEDKAREILSAQEKVVYLNCEVYDYNGITIYGTPLCKIFSNWSFMIPYEEQDKIYDSQLPSLPKIDILMSHDSPYGVSDIVLQKDCPWADGSHIGNESLRRFCEKLNPRYNVKGHLHSCNHGCEMLNDTEVYTVSLLDENYKMAYKPLYMEIDPI